jgi:hypothetical protein
MKPMKIITAVILLVITVLSCKQSTKQTDQNKASSSSVNTQAAGINSDQGNEIAGLRLSTFDVDVTPPIGNKIAYDSVLNSWDLGLRAKGIVLLGAGMPIVMCSVDWVCISNEAYDAFRDGLSKGAGTIPERVAIHTVHQHDTPWCDFTAEKVLKEAGLKSGCFDGSFAREVINRLEIAVNSSLKHSQPVTHLGLGEAQVNNVASNRRIMGKDGKVRATRYTATADSALRAEPEGLIDPILSMVSFWNGDKPIAVLSYYATHPQSYYHTCIPNPDFPGIARFLRQLAVPDALHVHFDGAGGNIGAGKYNDGSHANRLILAERLADGMKRAWESTNREPLDKNDVKWMVESVKLPISDRIKNMDAKQFNEPGKEIESVADGLAWLKRSQSGKKIDISCLTLGKARILHLPGELFVEYQLAAKAIRPDLFVTMAAYGDCGPGYIGTAISYTQGGYEPSASNVAPGSEEILMAAMKKLLITKP